MSGYRGSNDLWPEPDVDKLKKLWTEGKSASEIARAMPGRTRCAVIGKVHRLNLDVRGEPASFGGDGTVRRSRAPAVKSDKYAGNGHNARGGRPPKPGPRNVPGAVFGKVEVVDAAETERRRNAQAEHGRKLLDAFTAPANDDAILLLERRFGQCSWPVGEPARPADQMCCGQPVPADANRGIPTYCEMHGLRAISRTRLGGAPDVKAYERAYGRVA